MIQTPPELEQAIAELRIRNQRQQVLTNLQVASRIYADALRTLGTVRLDEAQKESAGRRVEETQALCQQVLADLGR